jgi:hypothetical protein
LKDEEEEEEEEEEIQTLGVTYLRTTISGNYYPELEIIVDNNTVQCMGCPARCGQKANPVLSPIIVCSRVDLVLPGNATSHCNKYLILMLVTDRILY